MYPKLKILTNKEFDKVICKEFINSQKGGIDFGAGIVKAHPNLIITRGAEEDRTRKIISDYFDKFYTKFDSDLNETIKNAQSKWRGKEKLFFNACDKYFNGHPWPKGRYEAYLSIINCNPRFLDNKTFQFYWKDKYGFPLVAVHEMLHFLFYDLVAKLLPMADLQSKKIWEVSEVFNGLIMAEKDLAVITVVKTPNQYPNLINLQNKLRIIWNKSKKADKFILSTLFTAH